MELWRSRSFLIRSTRSNTTYTSSCGSLSVVVGIEFVTKNLSNTQRSPPLFCKTNRQTEKRREERERERVRREGVRREERGERTTRKEDDKKLKWRVGNQGKGKGKGKARQGKLKAKTKNEKRKTKINKANIKETKNTREQEQRMKTKYESRERGSGRGVVWTVRETNNAYTTTTYVSEGIWQDTSTTVEHERAIIPYNSYPIDESNSLRCSEASYSISRYSGESVCRMY